MFAIKWIKPLRTFKQLYVNSRKLKFFDPPLGVRPMLICATCSLSSTAPLRPPIAWMHEWLYGWLHEWLHGQLYGWLHEWLHGRLHEWLHGRLHEWLHWRLHEWLHGQLYEWLNGLHGRNIQSFIHRAFTSTYCVNAWMAAWAAAWMATWAAAWWAAAWACLICWHQW